MTRKSISWYFNLQYCKCHKYNCISLEGYVEHMSQCVTSCPQGFLEVNDICEESIGDRDEGMVLAMIYAK